MKVIQIKVDGAHTIVVTLDGDSGKIESDLHVEAIDEKNGTRDELMDRALDGLESLILGHACAGLDIKSPKYVEGIETALAAIFHDADP